MTTKPKPKPKPKRKAKAPVKQNKPQSLETINVRINAGHKYKPGNRFWEMRSSHGNKPIFATPSQLWNAASEYYEWAEQNPLFEMKPFAHQGIVIQEPVAKMRIMTIESLCIFLDISRETWYAYAKKPDFSDTCKAIEEVIRQQGLTGASAGLLNPMIVARIHGLKESIAAELTGANGGPVQMLTSDMDAKTAADLYKTLMAGK